MSQLFWVTPTRPRKVESQRSLASLLKPTLGGNSAALPFLLVIEVSPS